MYLGMYIGHVDSKQQYIADAMGRFYDTKSIYVGVKFRQKSVYMGI
jgi:hypothetical protein